ncbi:MAG: hypothetical protein M5U22_21475 [Thermoleophilia bacterium]|nr:hypothetical protein [Thermoleophilia bacterium]
MNALLLAPIILALILLVVPLGDRGPSLDPRRRPGSMATLGVLFTGWLTLTLYAALTAVATHLG